MFLQHNDAFGNAHQIIRGDFDELFTRVGFENVAHPLVAEAAGREGACSMHGGYFVANNRNVFDRSMLDVRAVDADKNVFADDVPGGIAMVYADKVEIGWAVYRRAGIRFDQRERGRHLRNFFQRVGNPVQAVAKDRVIGAA